MRAHRPEAVGQADPVAEAATAVAAAHAQGQVGEVRGTGHADAGVGRHHLALGRGDVRATLQQLRRQGHRHLGQCRDVFAVGQGKIGRCLAQQHGDGVFQLGALPDQVDQVGLGAFQLGLRLGYRVLARDAGTVLVLGHFQRTLIGLDGGLEQALLLVEHPQLQVVLHQLRLQAQADRRHVGKAGLGAGLVGGQAVTQLAPQVGLPAHPQLGAIGVADAAAVVAQARA
ncbi:hypothetical protein D3C76_1004850 [compost metagenome]